MPKAMLRRNAVNAAFWGFTTRATWESAAASDVGVSFAGDGDFPAL
jgi:hypothetical protein